MQKTKLLLLAALLMIAGAAKAEITTDRVVISELTVEPGGNGDAVFTVSIEGSLQYTAYQISLALPEGLEVCVTDGEYDVYMLGTSGFYPRRGNSHSLGANVVNGVLNVACFSGTNALFSKTSGDLFDFYVKATPDLKPGDVDKYTIVTWIEGNDPECIDDIMGGFVKMQWLFSVDGEQL